MLASFGVLNLLSMLVACCTDYVVCNECTSHYVFIYCCAVQQVHRAPYSADAVQQVHLASHAVRVVCLLCTVHLHL